MSYRRVLPRDLFNEADLLKCYGRLWLLAENRKDIRFAEEDASSFAIDQDESDGSLTVTNLTFQIHGKTCKLYRPLNSRHAWPLWVDDGDDMVAVFTTGGELSPDMLQLIAENEPA